MLTLYLLRHAKSSWDQPTISDIERPLAARGREAAPRMGRHMREENQLPDLVLCSPATRARQTLELALSALGHEPEVRTIDGLYNFGDGSGLLQIIHREGGDSRGLMLVGHNPSLEYLALSLAGQGPSADLTEMAKKYPTAALAVIEFDVERWADIRAGAGRLVSFTKPKALRAA
ncbi:MAG: SixA phosphatase family protein [Hyphomicrobiales bacterium]